MDISYQRVSHSYTCGLYRLELKRRSGDFSDSEFANTSCSCHGATVRNGRQTKSNNSSPPNGVFGKSRVPPRSASDSSGLNSGRASDRQSKTSGSESSFVVLERNVGAGHKPKSKNTTTFPGDSAIFPPDVPAESQDNVEGSGVAGKNHHKETKTQSFPKSTNNQKDSSDTRHFVQNTSANNLSGQKGSGLPSTKKEREDCAKTETLQQQIWTMKVENNRLLKNLNHIRQLKDEQTNKVTILSNKNIFLEKALNHSLEDTKKLKTNMPSPRLFCNFTVTKMYEGWVRALQEQLKCEKAKLCDAMSLLKKSNTIEQELAVRVTLLEESLVFYRNLLEKVANDVSEDVFPKSVALPETFDEELCAKYGADLNSQFVARELYEALLVENAHLRQKLKNRGDSTRLDN